MAILLMSGLTLHPIVKLIAQFVTLICASRFLGIGLLNKSKPTNRNTLAKGKPHMFIIFATKPLNDRTNGFRFNFLGQKGLFRSRKKESRGWKVERMNPCMTAFHMGKRTVYFEHKQTKKVLRHFAG
jgi:hypothetical protein